MPYTVDITDATHPADTDQALVLGAEVREIKKYISKIPQNSQSANYTTVKSDAGKDIFHPSSDASARAWTIADNATVAYDIGTVLNFSVDVGAGNITLQIAGTDTLVFIPTGATGARTLVGPCQAVAVKKTATKWFISGPGVS